MTAVEQVNPAERAADESRGPPAHLTTFFPTAPDTRAGTCLTDRHMHNFPISRY